MADLDKCDQCKKPMTPEDLMRLDRSALMVYSWDGDGNDTVHHGYFDQLLCSKECLIKAMELKAKDLPKNEQVRCCFALTMTEPGARELLESVARMLRSIP